MKMLEGAGVPYAFDKETNGYIVRRDFFMPAVEMTLDESLALLALAERIGGDEQVPFTKAAAKAISKIRCNLSPAIQQELKQVEDHVAIRLAAISQPQGTEDVYQLMRRMSPTPLKYAACCWTRSSRWPGGCGSMDLRLRAFP